jgi:hypothetical protein
MIYKNHLKALKLTYFWQIFNTKLNIILFLKLKTFYQNILRTFQEQTITKELIVAPFIVFAPYNPICIKLDSNHKKKILHN